MSHAPNELADQFPRDAENLHRLRVENAHFRQLADEYHALNRRIHRSETDMEPVSDVQLEAMKKTRLSLLDAIAIMLRVDGAQTHGPH
ncbi:MAG: DUF465 domain-containing protein [Pseudomonadota bacterium]